MKNFTEIASYGEKRKLKQISEMCPWDTDAPGGSLKTGRRHTSMTDLKRGDTVQLTLIMLQTNYQIKGTSMYTAKKSIKDTVMMSCMDFNGST